VTTNVQAWRHAIWLALPLSIALATTVAAASQLADGTAVPIRLVSPITSWDAQTGDEVHFVVRADVAVDGKVLIKKGTPVLGRIVKAQRAHWGWTEHDAKLWVAFTGTVTTTGYAIRLRTTLVPPQTDIEINRDRLEHRLQWASEADAFTAYVDGDYTL
jgi:hypothetical protein